MKNNTANSLLLAAAFAGIMGGTTLRLQAQPAGHGTPAATAGIMVDETPKSLPKHSCKGKNDCKGQGGGDAKHAGKNSCKGKGACATDGSKPSK